MNRFPFIAVLVAAVLFAAAFVAEEPIGPVPQPVQVGAWMTQSFALDWDGLNRDGQPHQSPVTTVIFRYSIPGGDAVAWSILGLPVPATAGTITVPLSEALRVHGPHTLDLSLEVGRQYLVDVKLRTVGGGEGNYSPSLLIVVAPEPPPPERPTTTTAPRVVEPPEEP